MTRPNPPTHPVEQLSFVGWRDSEPGRHFWRVTATGDYPAQCAAGQTLALEYLAFEERHAAGILQHIVADMPRPLTGLEIGFLETVALAAGAGGNRARAIVDRWERLEAAAQ